MTLSLFHYVYLERTSSSCTSRWCYSPFLKRKHKWIIKYKDQLKWLAGLAPSVSELALSASGPGFSRQKTGFIRQHTVYMSRWIKPVGRRIKPVRWQMKLGPLADKASPLTDKASPAGPYFFSFFLNYLLFVSRDSNTIRISIKKCLFWDPMLIYLTIPLIK